MRFFALFSVRLVRAADDGQKIPTHSISNDCLPGHQKLDRVKK